MILKKVKDILGKKKKSIKYIQYIATSKSAKFFLPETKGIEFHENVILQE